MNYLATTSLLSFVLHCCARCFWRGRRLEKKLVRQKSTRKAHAGEKRDGSSRQYSPGRSYLSHWFTVWKDCTLLLLYFYGPYFFLTDCGASFSNTVVSRAIFEQFYCAFMFI